MGCSIVGVIIALILSMLAAPLAANAQPVGKLPRLGILAPGTPPGRAVEALRQGLRDLGYVEGQTIALEIRWDEGKPERSPDPMPPSWWHSTWTFLSREPVSPQEPPSTPPALFPLSWRRTLNPSSGGMWPALPGRVATSRGCH